jgi:Winged helix DNA-binding domain
VAEPRTLTQRELNRALLARQMLLERAPLTIPRALERMGGLQAQYAPSMYIGLWSRIQGFERDALTEALQRRRVVQGTLQRATIHLVSKRDYWPFEIAVRDARREAWRKPAGRAGSIAKLPGAARKLRPRLAEGPIERAELDKLVGGGAQVINGVGMYVSLVRVPPSGTWERRRADIYAAAEDWVGPPNVEYDDAVEHVIRRYLGGFGPAAIKDIADWTGLPGREITRALSRIKTREFAGPSKEKLVDLPRAPIPDGDTPAPVRFLPVWDATLLVHARSTGILPEKYRPRIFNTKTPHSVNTFLVDGEVAGTWRYDKGEIKVQPYGKRDKATRRELDAEAEKLAVFHA